MKRRKETWVLVAALGKEVGLLRGFRGGNVRTINDGI